MRDRELKALLQRAIEPGPAPSFDQCWRKARRQADQGGHAIDWRWAYGPTLAASLGAAVVALLVLARTGETVPSTRPSLQAERTGLPPAAARPSESGIVLSPDDSAKLKQPLPLDWLLDDENAFTENGLPSRDERSYPAEGSETDFLLTIEIPSWNGREVREVL